MTGDRIDRAIKDSPPDTTSSESDKFLVAETRTMEQEVLKQQVADMEQDRVARKQLGPRTFWLVVAWLFLLWVVVVLEGFSPLGFRLGAPIVLGLIGGTTATVVSLFLVVANYLFQIGGRRRRAAD